MVENMLKPTIETVKNRRIRRLPRVFLRIFPAVILLGLSTTPGTADEGVVGIATLIPYAEKAEIRNSIREDCGLGSKLSKLVVARSQKHDIAIVRVGNLGSGAARNETDPARNLDLRITDAIETSSGLLPTHSLSIDGVLKEDGRVIGTFVGTRFARASFIPFRRGECAILSEAVRLLAKDVVRWMRKPDLEARLGDAH